MREGYLEGRGIAYRTNDFKDGRPTLLLLHGFAGSASQWGSYEKLWEQKYNLVIPDLRGHGKSKHWPRVEEYAPEAMADDFIALLAELKIEKCIVVGYSLGSYVALALWLKQKQLVEKMILVAPLYHFSSLWKIRLTRPIFSALAFVSKTLPVGGAHSRIDYSTSGYASAGDENVRRIFADFRHTGARSYFYNIKDICGFAEDDAWKQVSCPTGIIYGKRDDFMPRERIDAITKFIPHATLHILPNADHLMVINDVAEVAQAIEQFVD